MMALSASEEEDEMKKKIEEALGSLVSCRVRCSKMLEDARRRRIMEDLDQRCLAFLEKEMSLIVACLTAALTSPQRHANDEGMMGWLEELIVAASDTLPRALDKPDPQHRHTLLRRATQCIGHRHRHPYRLKPVVEQFYRLAEHPCRYYLLPFEPHHLHFKTINILPSLKRTINLIALYLIMFPYRYMFEMHRLVMKWSCEGILNYQSLSDLQDLGEGIQDLHFLYLIGDLDLVTPNFYFSHLVHMNLITHAAANSRPNNNSDEAETWQVNVNHLQLQSLASKSAELGFAFTTDTLNLLAAAPAKDHGMVPRRLAIHHDDPNIPSLLQKIDLSQTRSLAVSGAVRIVPLEEFVNLVVLDVQGWENFGDEDLLRVCTSKMFFLKYLSIRNTRVSKLPPQMKELCSLQVLDASYTLVTELQLEVFQATRSIHRLDLRGTPIRQLTLPVPNQLRWLQRSLEVLLIASEGIISSAETATTLPHNIVCFSSLQTLATVYLREQPVSFIKALGDLQNLRVIAITWSFHQSSDRDYCEALLSSIKRWSFLKSLTIHCGLGCSMEFLGFLSHMSSGPTTFRVTVGRFAGVPKWFGRQVFLSFIQITVCKLGDRDLEILRDLPRLKCLILGLDFIPKKAIVIDDKGFFQLRRFSIECQVPWLIFKPRAMRHLTYLQLNLCYCPTSPIAVPWGISNLFWLTEVALWYNVRYTNRSSVKMIVEAVRRAVAELEDNTSRLFINGIEQQK